MDGAYFANADVRDVDLRECKAIVARYPRGHPLRESILQEPDVLTRGEAAARLAIYLRMILGPRPHA